MIFYALALWHLAQAAFWLRLAQSSTKHRQLPPADHETGARTRQALEELQETP